MAIGWTRMGAAPAALGCCAMIAVKARCSGKSRLGTAVTDVSRIRLIRAMLVSVLDAVRRAHSVQQCVVISPERDDVPRDVPVLADAGLGLNEAFTDGHRALRRFGFRRFLFLPADVPTLRDEDVDCLVAAGLSAGVAIAGDRHNEGTNGLFLDDLPDFRLKFGPHSCELHQAEARRMGRSAALVTRPGLAFDVDRPGDYLEYGRMHPSQRWRA